MRMMAQGVHKILSPLQNIINYKILKRNALDIISFQVCITELTTSVLVVEYLDVIHYLNAYLYILHTISKIVIANKNLEP